MKRLSRAAAALGAFAVAAIVPAVPTISTVSAAEAPMGYVVTSADAGCELQQIDLTTGALTDLPAAGSQDACGYDIAVSPSGVVYGVTMTEGEGPGAAQLITFATDGTPSLTPITVEGASDLWMAMGGIAISAGGTVYVHLVVSTPGCDTGTTPPDTSAASPLYEGDSVCLFTLDTASGAATLIGTTGQFETVFYALTSCTSGLRTLYLDNDTESPLWATESATTGVVTPGPAVDQQLGGYDCPSSGDTLYAVINPASDTGRLRPTAVGEVAGVGTVNTATGVYTENAELSNPEAYVMALGVVPTTVPTTIEVANATEIAPAFTG